MNIEVNGIQITLTKKQLAQIEKSKKKKKSPETLFKEFVLDKISIHNPVVDLEKYPNHIFYLDANGEYICEWDYKNKWFLFHYERVWTVFEDKLNLKFTDIQEIMRVKVEEHFGLKGVTPLQEEACEGAVVEKHFKNKLG